MDDLSNKAKVLRFIPFRKADVIEMCVQQGGLGSTDQILFREFCFRLQSLFHYQFHQQLEALKDVYVPLDPDADTRQVELPAKPGMRGNIAQDPREFSAMLEALLVNANYEKLDQSDLAQALQEASIFKIRLQVDFEDFSDVLIYLRGESVQEETVSSWFGLRKKVIEFVNYDRVLIYIKFKDDFIANKSALRSYQSGATLLKLFQNVPKADIEMLFPNTQVRMRNIDKIMIGVPAAISGGIVLATKLGATLILLASLIGFWIGLHTESVALDNTALATLFFGLAALGSYLWKQFSSFSNRKLRFMQTLMKNLYFKNLDNNAGVFHRLIDEAEEEECKEAILAYYFLLAQIEPISQAALDDIVEKWFKTCWQYALDFEISDALDKLEKLGLIEKTNDLITVLPLDQAVMKMQSHWNDALLFKPGKAHS